jgi:hypothetical protein
LQATENGLVYSARHRQSIRQMVLHMNHLSGIWSDLTGGMRLAVSDSAGGDNTEHPDRTSAIGATLKVLDD